MFKVGDKVVYIHTVEDYYSKYGEIFHAHDDILKYGDVYTIDYIFGTERVYFDFVEIDLCSFQADYFISFKEFRKKKLKKINNTI